MRPPLQPNPRKLGIQFSGTPDKIFVKVVTQESFGCIHGVQAGDELLEVDGILLDMLENQFKERLAGRPIRLRFSSPHSSYTVAADHENEKLGVTFHGMPPGSVEVKSVTEGLFGSDKGVQEGDVLTDAGRDSLQSLDGMSAETFKSFLKDRPLRLRFQTLQKARRPIEEHELPRQHSRTEYTVAASADTGKLGISFHSMPPGRIEVKGVAAGLFGSTSGVKEGDVLIEVGSDDLQPLESISEEAFKGLLKDRPLKMRFLAPAIATAAPVLAETSSSHVDHGTEQRTQSEMPATDRLSRDTYTITAGLEVGKLGITFNGMPPGRIDVKGLAENSFGNDAGVREGDVLTEVGKDELTSVEGMDSETFKRLLKDRPLTMKFQSMGEAVPAVQSASPNDAAAAAPDAAAAAPTVATNTSVAEQETTPQALGSREYTVAASADTGKLGISFHSMPPGRIEVKGVAAGLFGSTSGVKEGDVLIEVGSDDLQPLESISEEAFKGLLKDRPLKMRFLAPAIATAAPVLAETSSSHVDHGTEQRTQSEMPATDRLSRDTYTITAGLEVGKLGITFNGMPPGRIDVKGLAENSFGNDAGVREGDVLTEVGKDELTSVEGMDPETFKRLLKDRPLTMKFQSMGEAVPAGQSASPNDAAAAAPTVATNTSVAEQEIRPQKMDLPADASDEREIMPKQAGWS